MRMLDAVSLLGLPLFYVPVTIYLATIGLVAAVHLAISFAIIESICALIKLIYPKDRPVPMRRTTIIERYMAGGFPSVHSARIAALALGVHAYFPSALITAGGILAALTVGYSRIYLKKHDIVDVTGGFPIGIFISAVLLRS